MKIRCVIIEDDPPSLELMRYLLEAQGFEILAATDGVEGLDLIRRDNPELVVCDIHLPRMDGYGVAKTMKQDPNLRSIPLIAVTALAMVGDRDRVLSAGFDGYVAKPIMPETFAKQVSVYLRMKVS